MGQEIQKPHMIFGTKGNDVLTASKPGGGHLIAGAGDDYLLALNSGSNVLHGGDGNDWLQADGFSNILYGERGDDDLNVRNDRNRIHGNEGDDQFQVKGNDHLVTGGLGNDDMTVAVNGSSVHGGAGDDHIRHSSTSYGEQSNRSTFDLGEGQDQLRLYGWNNQVLAGSGDDTVSVYFVTQSRIDAGAGNDTLIVEEYWNHGNTFIGGFGDDRIYNYTDQSASDRGSNNRYYGGGGNDTIYVSGELETALGGTGNDTLLAAESLPTNHAVLKGESGNDIIGFEHVSSGRFNLIDGGDGNDTLSAKDKYNTLTGGAGSDELSVKLQDTSDNTLSGGRGSDTYRIGEDTGLNWIREEGLVRETDRVIFEAVSASEVTVGRQGNALQIYSESEKLLIEDFWGKAGSRVEQFLFSDGTLWTDKQVESLIQAMAASGTAAGTADGNTASPAPEMLSLLLAGQGTSQL
ncbi:RTX toxins and-related Ca2+-binding protein [Paenibacillus mucilaginosus 3016]|uniref:RTX toxins and-related Ca2+-binding protein n=2 Tax=Paenibacillus mucilaginosus TaxID=61624 RepID=H6NHX5_9BACL|nr:calcium-binding protein [Paenibacillus mucilaginosus]AFC30196.1 RTX toxins and-related Ca2+-binding protein [Paenibacillus mucilaginosus 3016]AFH62467.1 calcium-binding protein [Paenibacillus mucilaginosus K02]WFA18841.1 calcium-binding protein [Paenibacillus mucilaginosus]